MNVLEIEHLTYAYPGAEKPVLQDITFNVEKGDFLAVIGNNGCGKSTLCKTLNGLIPQFISGDFSGRVMACGLDTKDTDIGTLAQKVGYVYQDFENQILRPTVLDDASYACLNYAMPDYRERGRMALKQCGLSDRENDFIWQLSGGQTHLLALAGALSLGPDILILDEPIAQLDPMHADRIYEVLKELNEVYGKTIIVIEHHTEYIAEYCRHVMLLKDGRLQWTLPANEALRRVSELQECNIFPPQVTVAAYRMQRQGILPKQTLLPVTAAEGVELFSRFCVMKNTSEKKSFSESVSRETVASFENVTVSYRSVKGSPRQVFSGLNLNIHKGDKVALIGSNGAGKSTLMKLMVGLLKPSSGDIRLYNKSLGEVKPETLSGQVSMVYQNPEDMFIKDSVVKDIAYAMEVRGVKDISERIDELLKRFRLTAIKDRDGRLLSGGQMRRASLAIGAALNPGILLLDEPTANLDIATRREIISALEEMKEITETVIIATHDMQLVCEWADRVIVLMNGRVIADGSLESIFADREIIRTAGIRPPEIFSVGQELSSEAFCYTIEEFLSQFT